jgi:hypothetical protein
MGQPSPFGLSSEITPLVAEGNPYVAGRFSLTALLVGESDGNPEDLFQGAIGEGLENLILTEAGKANAANNIVRFGRVGAQSAQSGLSPINTMNRMANLRMQQLASQGA